VDVRRSLASARREWLRNLHHVLRSNLPEEKTFAHSARGKKNFLTITVLSDDSSPGMRRRAEKHGRRIIQHEGQTQPKPRRNKAEKVVLYTIFNTIQRGLIIIISRTVPINHRVGSSTPIRRATEAKWKKKKLIHILKRSCEEAHAKVNHEACSLHGT
jgi:hypothetical protein